MQARVACFCVPRRYNYFPTNQFLLYISAQESMSWIWICPLFHVEWENGNIIDRNNSSKESALTLQAKNLVFKSRC